MDRTKGVGGSDIHKLFSLPPYGCARELWYEKTGVTPNFPFYGNYLTERGLALEPVAAIEYMRRTGRKIRRQPEELYKDDWASANIDRWIMGKEKGILELKVPSKHTYDELQHDGVRDMYILQLQHYMHVADLSWGSFGILCVDGMYSFTCIDTERNEKLIKKIVKTGKAFWRDVQEKNPPKRLDVDDQRCGKCQFRTTCQGEWMIENVGGIEEDESLAGLAEKYKEAQVVAKNSEKEFEKIKATIKELVGEREVITTSKGNISYKVQVTNRVNLDKLQNEYPEIYGGCLQKNVSRVLRITKRKDK